MAPFLDFKLVVNDFGTFMDRSRRSRGITSFIVSPLAVELEARDTTRPVLVGLAEPGEAWADYRDALDLFAVGKGAESLAALRAGARRGKATYPVNWDKAYAQRTPNPAHVTRVVSLAIKRAESMIEGGHADRAIAPLLDALQSCRDLMHAPHEQVEQFGTTGMGQALRSGLIRFPRLAVSSPA